MAEPDDATHEPDPFAGIPPWDPRWLSRAYATPRDTGEAAGDKARLQREFPDWQVHRTSAGRWWAQGPGVTVPAAFEPWITSPDELRAAIVAAEQRPRP